MMRLNAYKKCFFLKTVIQYIDEPIEKANINQRKFGIYNYLFGKPWERATVIKMRLHHGIRLKVREQGRSNDFFFRGLHMFWYKETER